MHDGVRFLRHGALHGCLSRFAKGTSRRLNVDNQPLHALSAACIRDGLKNTILVFDLRRLLVANDCRSVRLQRFYVPSECLQHLGWLDVMNRVHGNGSIGCVLPSRATMLIRTFRTIRVLVRIFAGFIISTDLRRSGRRSLKARLGLSQRLHLLERKQ